jgi:protein TonB
MTEADEPPTDPRPPSLPARLLAALHPRRHGIGLAMFGLALVCGAFASLWWMHAHRAPPVAVAVDAAVAPDPQHPPLPAPMPGGLASMPADIPSAPNAAYIKPEPAPAPPLAANTSVALPMPTTNPNGAETSAVPFAVASSNESGPQLVKRTRPQYPIDALRQRDEGSVQLQIALDATGAIRDVQVSHSSGSRSLDRAALDAVRNWQFRPAIHDGQPAASTLTEIIDFHLDEH